MDDWMGWGDAIKKKFIEMSPGDLAFFWLGAMLCLAIVLIPACGIGAAWLNHQKEMHIIELQAAGKLPIAK